MSILLPATPPLWPTQVRAIEGGFASEKAGNLGTCITGPTGSGKRRILTEMVKRTLEEGGRPGVFTNRKLITRQTYDEFFGHGIDFGVMAAGYEGSMGQDALIISVQTLTRRGMFPFLTRAFIDEAHLGHFDPVIETCKSRGIPYHGLTATPVGLKGKYDNLVIAGKNSELRQLGALVACDVFAPSEPDMKGVKMNALGEYVQNGMAKRVMQCTVFADVFDHWCRLNPGHEPTLVFAPGVPESRWFAQEFSKRGVPAAHIDGDTPERERQDIIEAHREGQIKVISSFGVLREGADLPWVVCGILAQVCGGLSTFLQIVGRLLRASPSTGKTKALLLDFAGAWHRHGSPNADREWGLEDTDKALAKKQLKERQKGEGTPEPVCCPKCHGVRKGGPKCPFCGYEHTKSVRMVRMLDGALKKMTGNTVKKKKDVSEDQKVWTETLFQCGKSGRTIAQAAHLFRARMEKPVPLDVYPKPPDHSGSDWQRRVRDVFPWTVKNRKVAS